MYDLKAEIARTLKAWNTGNPVGPAMLEFYPTQKCNLRCRTCIQPQSYDKNDFELPDEEFVRIIEEAIELGTRIFHIGGGGEPFYRRELVLKLMRMIKEKGRHGALTSNTTLLQKSDLEMIVKIGWDDVHFSIDGPDPETCDYLRGAGTFRKAVQALQWLNEYKREYNKKDPFLILNFVISNKNFRSIPDYIRFAGENQAGYIFFNHMIMHSSSFKYLQLSEEDKKSLTDIIREAQELSDKLKLDTNLSEIVSATKSMSGEGEKTGGLSRKILSRLRFFKPKISRARNKGSLKNAYCLKPWYHLVLQTSGKVGPCCIFQNPRVNLYKHSLKEIWIEKYFSDLRRAMTARQPPPECSNCPPVMREEVAGLAELLPDN